MMFRLFFAIFILSLFYDAATDVRASDASVNIELASNHIDINSVFTGAELVVFGSRKGQGRLAVVLEGPPKNVDVREKVNFFGAWVSRLGMRFMDVPVYYDYAVEGMDKAIFYTQGIGLKPLHFSTEVSDQLGENYEERYKKYKDALIKRNQVLGFYPENPKQITFLSDDFFKVVLHVPANIYKGSYLVRAYLIDDDVVVARDVKQLEVKQVGFNNDVNNFARENSFLYAMLVVILAIFSGWVSNKIARRS